MPTAEWYEQQARKIKLKTWPESERFTKMNRLDLTLTDKLSKIKPELIQYATDPIKQYSLSARDKQTLDTLKKYAPSLFKEAQQPQFLKKPAQVALQSAQNIEQKAKVYGLGGATPMKTYLETQRLTEPSLGERVQDLNTKLKRGILGLLTAPEKSMTAAGLKGGELMPESLLPTSQQWGFVEKPKTMKEVLIPQPPPKAPPGYVKETSKAAWEAFLESLGGDYTGEYKGQTFKALRLKQDPELGINYEWAKDQEDWLYGTNWLQKVAAAFAGSPADIQGLTLDIFSSPFIHITGGIGRATNLGSLTDALQTRTGTTLLSRGSTLAVTKEGLSLINKQLPKVLPQIEKTYAKELATFAGKGAVESAQRFTYKKAAEYIIKNAVKNLDDVAAKRLIEFGGLKLGSETLIKGEKIEQTFSKLFKNVSVPAKLKALNRIFNPWAETPMKMRPILSAMKSQAIARKTELSLKFNTIIKPLNKAERITLNKYGLITENISKIQNKADDFIKALEGAQKAPTTLFANEKRVAALKGLVTRETNKITKLDELLTKLPITPKITKAHKEIRGLLDELYSFEKSKIPDLKYLKEYFPPRYETEKLPSVIKGTELGSAVAPFEKPQTLDYLTALKKGLVPKKIEESFSQRFLESATRTSRADLLNNVKQFGQMADEPIKGYAKALDYAGDVIPELKGWQFPKEIENTFRQTYTTFFGDESVKNWLKVYDNILTIWKRVVIATPGFHLRNFRSDVFSGLMEWGPDFLRLKYWIGAKNIFRGKTLTVGGKKVTSELFTEYGIKQGQIATEAALVSGKARGTLGKISPLEWSARFGAGRESFGRTVGALISLDKGDDIIDAAWTVKKVFLDYQLMTSAERNIGIRLFPFYRWMRKNIERQFELIAIRTGRYTTIPKIMNYIEGVAETRFGQEYIEEYKQFKPDFYEKQGAMITGAMNKEGQPIVFAPDLPYVDLLNFGAKDLYSKMSPLLKMGVEIPGKRDIFTGAQLDWEEMKPAPKWLSAIAGKLPESLLVQMGMEKKNGEVEMSGATEYALKQIPGLYNLSRMMPAEETAKTSLDLMSILGGLRFYNVDMGKLKEYKYKQFVTKMGDLIKRKIPEGEILDTDDMKSAYEQIYVNYLKTQYPKYAVAQSIKEKIKYAGGSTKEINLMIDLMEKPYNEAMDKIKDMSLPELAKMLSELGINPTKEEIITVSNQLKAGY